MKKTLYLSLFLLLLCVLRANAQAGIDETNLITRLTSINNLNVTDAVKYFTDRSYTLVSKQTVPQATFSMDLYKYRLEGQTASYLFSVIAGAVSGAGYITYNEDEYTQAIKTITDLGFVPGEATAPESGKTIYAKGNFRLMVQKKVANNKTFYVMMYSDLLKVATLSGFKK